MDYEKKYKEALSFLKDLKPYMSDYCIEKLEGFFPELIESEDERIKREILELVSISGNGNQFEEIKNWLEKQGKQKPEEWCFPYNVNETVDKLMAIAECLEMDEDFLYNGYTGTECVKFLRDLARKQVECNPTDEIKLKFNIGDWITNGEYTWNVTDIQPLDYILQSPNGVVVYDDISYVDEHFHLWTIQDANDGDILMAYAPFIFNGNLEGGIGCPGAHCGINTLGEFQIPKYQDHWTGHTTTPATKEQRDLLFQKMKEAGYEWDAEKKELKNIEQKQDWSKKQDEQNHTDKIEPKFKLSDWVIDKHYLKTYQVFSVDNSERNYIVYSCKPLFNTDRDWPCFHEDTIRLWTIQDAKDGDILEFGDHGRLVIGIVSYVNKTTGKVDVNCLLENNNFKLGNYYNLDTIKPHPATEEQRDLLFRKMKEAGYEWDDKKKELKKIEPKFKVGDCVVYNRNDSSREILYVYDIRDSRYYFNDNIHLSWSVKACDEKCHLWTIQDAKDGDVLAEHETIVLFKKIEDQNIRCYCTYHYLGFNPAFYVDTLQNKNPYRPATKEQHDLLFQQMKDAGYEWDNEKKELKKLEQASAWSEEDEERIEFLIAMCDDEQAECVNNSTMYRECTETKDWLKSIKPNHWKPSEEQMNALDKAKNSPANYHDIRLGLQSLYNDLARL